MPKIAYLGPDYSFSHDLLTGTFPEDEHLPCESLHEVVKKVVDRECETGVVPFYNTTRMSIEETQLELVRNKGKVFVEDVLTMEIRHCLGGFGTVDAIKELRSKSVVFHQVSKWLGVNLPNCKQIDSSSTSRAIQSIAEEQAPSHVAAIGTKSACKHYAVPVIKADIQNQPNHTLFFVVTSQKPEKPEQLDHLLMCAPGATDVEKDAISGCVLETRCGISCNWSVEFNASKGGPESAYFFEIDGHFSKLGLYSAVKKVNTQFPKTFLVGGYEGKCITRLIWASEQPR